MDPLDGAQARGQLEMIDRILAASQQRLCAGGEFFVVWGLFSAAATWVGRIASTGPTPVAALWGLAAGLVVCIVFSAIRGYRMALARGRESIVQREFFSVLWLTIGLAFIVNLGVYRIFSGLASDAIWSFAEATVLLYIGIHGNRRALAGGVVLVLSMIVANFVAPQQAAYALMAGMILGYAGFGLAELLART